MKLEAMKIDDPRIFCKLRILIIINMKGQQYLNLKLESTIAPLLY